MVLHTFGDSHSGAGWSGVNIPGVKIVIHTIGPYLMYRFGREKLRLLNISDKAFGVAKGDWVCFCFGEIDCRCHIHKFGEDYERVIKSLVDDYMKAVFDNIGLVAETRALVFNVVPPVSTAVFRPPEPFICRGTDDERKKYSLCMNDHLRDGCKRMGYLFVDIYDNYKGENGMLDAKFSDGLVHIGNPCFLENFLRRVM